MIAITSTDLVGGLILAFVGGFGLLVDGLRDLARNRRHRLQGDAGGFPGEPVAGRPVEPAGTLAAGDLATGDGATGSPTWDRSPAASIEYLTFPGTYNRAGMKR